MPIERAAALGIAVVSALLVARLGPGAIRSWMIYSGTGKRRQVDASGLAPAAPPGVRDRLAMLTEAGYRHIGETRLDLPVGPRFAWIMAAADSDSYAIVAGGTGRVALTGLYSAWPDGMWLGTINPMGSPTVVPGCTCGSCPRRSAMRSRRIDLDWSACDRSMAIRARCDRCRTCSPSTPIIGSVSEEVDCGQRRSGSPSRPFSPLAPWRCRSSSWPSRSDDCAPDIDSGRTDSYTGVSRCGSLGNLRSRRSPPRSSVAVPRWRRVRHRASSSHTPRAEHRTRARRIPLPAGVPTRRPNSGRTWLGAATACSTSTQWPR